jgi:hypothetical protein
MTFSLFCTTVDSIVEDDKHEACLEMRFAASAVAGNESSCLNVCFFGIFIASIFTTIINRDSDAVLLRKREN